MSPDLLADLAERVARIEAREDIRTLVARYGMAVDDRDVDLVGDLFTADGVFRHINNTYVCNGRQAIVEYYANRIGAYGVSFHYPHSHIIDFDGPTSATGLVTAHAELGVERTTFVTALRYHDTYVVDRGAWKFKERAISMLYYMSLTDLMNGGLNETDRKRYFDDIGPADYPESLPSWQAFANRR